MAHQQNLKQPGAAVPDHKTLNKFSNTFTQGLSFLDDDRHRLILSKPLMEICSFSGEKGETDCPFLSAMEP
jgi:hypothetical protein